MCSNDGDDAGWTDSDGRPDPAAFMANLRQPMPLGRKVRLVVKNTWRKIYRAKSCCGNPGEPGC